MLKKLHARHEEMDTERYILRNQYNTLARYLNQRGWDIPILQIDGVMKNRLLSTLFFGLALISFGATCICFNLPTLIRQLDITALGLCTGHGLFLLHDCWCARMALKQGKGGTLPMNARKSIVVTTAYLVVAAEIAEYFQKLQDAHAEEISRFREKYEELRKQMRDGEFVPFMPQPEKNGKLSVKIWFYPSVGRMGYGHSFDVTTEYDEFLKWLEYVKEQMQAWVH